MHAAVLSGHMKAASSHIELHHSFLGCTGSCHMVLCARYLVVCSSGKTFYKPLLVKHDGQADRRAWAKSKESRRKRVHKIIICFEGKKSP